MEKKLPNRDDGVFLATSLDGVDVFDVYVRSKLTEWKIAAGLPLAMYEAPLRHTLYALTAIIVFGLTCSIAISFGYARYLLKPVNALQALVASSNVTNFKLLKSGVKEVDDVADALAKSFMLLNDRDQHQQVLVKELNHRAKNALAAIQAIAYATQKIRNHWMLLLEFLKAASPLWQDHTTSLRETIGVLANSKNLSSNAVNRLQSWNALRLTVPQLYFRQRL